MSKRVNPIENFFIRYHVVLLVVIGSIALGASIASSYFAYSTATTPPEQAATTSDIPTTFDAQTIERINNLYTSDQENTDVSLPQGRINPFAE